MLSAKIFSVSEVWEVVIPLRFPEVLFIIIIGVLLTLAYSTPLQW